MFTQKTKLSILGLAVSLTVFATGCGPAFESNKKGKAGSALAKAGAPKIQEKAQKSDQQLADELFDRTQREAAIKAKDTKGETVAINDSANMYITGASIEREGDQLVFSAFLKENSQDNQGSVELRAKLPKSANGEEVQLDSSLINLVATKGARTEVEPKAEEYSVRSTCQKDCEEMIVRLQRKNDNVAYAAEFIFDISKGKKESDTLSSSLAENANLKSFKAAAKEALVEVDEAGSEITSEEDKGSPSVEAVDSKPAPTAQTAPKAEAAPVTGHSLGGGLTAKAAKEEMVVEETTSAEETQAPPASEEVAKEDSEMKMEVVGEQQKAAPSTQSDAKKASTVAKKRTVTKNVTKPMSPRAKLLHQTAQATALAVKQIEFDRVRKEYNAHKSNLVKAQNSLVQKRSSFKKTYESYIFFNTYKRSDKENALAAIRDLEDRILVLQELKNRAANKLIFITKEMDLIKARQDQLKH